MARLVQGQRGGVVFVSNGLRYQLNRRREEFAYWRCWRRECRAPLKTNEFGNNADLAVIINVGEHNHPADDEIITRDDIVNHMKDHIEGQLTQPVKRAYDETVAGLARHGIEADVPEYHRIRAQLHGKKSRLMPAIPDHVEDVVIEGEWAETWNHQRHLLALDNDWGVAVFSTDEGLQLLQEASCIYLDATFRSTPRWYSQFFTILCQLNARVIYCASALMSEKNIGSYRRVLQIIKERILENMHLNWIPEQAVTDFELALIAAIETEFPDIHMTGCYFHFSQSLWRHIQQLGLSVPYGNDPDLKNILRVILAIGYLPLLLVRINFMRIRNSDEAVRLTRQYPSLADFFHYFQGNYIQGNFPPRLWNVFTRPMDCRTNIFVESFHHKWNTAISVRHPSLWHFLHVFKDQASLSHINIQAMRNGEPAPPRKRKWRVLEERINLLKDDYRAG